MARFRSGAAWLVPAALLVSTEAGAIPLFARQTGQQCAACHNGFPELTPYGRLFKLNGYTFGGGQSRIPPISAMAVASFTHTQADQLPNAAPHYAKNDNFAFDFASLFYGGVILPHLGLFGQATYNNISKSASWDNTDLRFADTVNLGPYEAILGIDVNNNPTVQDVWNSTPAWGFPWLSSGLAGTPAARTLIEGGLAQQVVGLSAYTYVDRLLYLEAGLYRSLGNRLLFELGANPNPPSPINGAAPYWRVALEPKWGSNSLEFGAFGLNAAIVPGDASGLGTDHISDVGVDTQYQYLGAIHAVSFDASLIAEEQRLDASLAQGLASNRTNHLRSARAKVSYYYQQTYGGTLGWFHVDGSRDALLYSANSATNSPNSTGFIGELDYIPFNHGGPSFWPWLNLKLGLQYIYYTRFDGGTTNFDGAGHNATDNNTLYAFVWLAF